MGGWGPRGLGSPGWAHIHLVVSTSIQHRDMELRNCVASPSSFPMAFPKTRRERERKRSSTMQNCQCQEAPR